jgi:hypothetical protein
MRRCEVDNRSRRFSKQEFAWRWLACRFLIILVLLPWYSRQTTLNLAVQPSVTRSIESAANHDLPPSSDLLTPFAHASVEPTELLRLRLERNLRMLHAVRTDLSTLQVSLRDSSFTDFLLQPAHVPLDTHFQLFLLGNNLNAYTIELTSELQPFGSPCNKTSAASRLHGLSAISASETVSPDLKDKPDLLTTYEFTGKLSESLFKPGDYFFCVRAENVSIHQGTKKWVHLRLYHNSLQNLLLLMVIAAIGLALSALFSGLTLGIMTLDPNELKVLIR